MRIIPVTTTIAVLTRTPGASGLGVLFARVTRSPLGNSATRLGTVHDVEQSSSQELQSAAGGVAKGKLIVVLPAQDCFAKPIAMAAGTFSRARDEVAQTIDELFPISSSDAMIGLINRSEPAQVTDQSTGAETGTEAGYLLAAQRSRVQPAIDAISSALRASVWRVLAPHMAAPGLPGMHGKKSQAVNVLEAGVGGNSVTHTYMDGEAVRLSMPAGSTSSHAARFPAALDAEGAKDAYELAVAASILDDVAPGILAPMEGSVPSRSAHWVAPLFFAAAAAGLFLVAGVLSNARYASAADSEDARAASMQSAYDSAQLDRDRLDAIAADIARARELGFPRIGRTLADVWSAVTVLPSDAYFTRIELTPARAILDGIAVSSGDVLARLEASEAFEDARRERGSGRVPGDLTRETFSLSATRLFDDRSDVAQ